MQAELKVFDWTELANVTRADVERVKAFLSVARLTSNLDTAPQAASASLAGASKEDVLAAEAVPTQENCAFLRVVWLRPAFERDFRAVTVDVRKLPAP